MVFVVWKFSSDAETLSWPKFATLKWMIADIQAVLTQVSVKNLSMFSQFILFFPCISLIFMKILPICRVSWHIQFLFTIINALWQFWNLGVSCPSFGVTMASFPGWLLYFMISQTAVNTVWAIFIGVPIVVVSVSATNNYHGRLWNVMRGSTWPRLWATIWNRCFFVWVLFEHYLLL